MTAREDAMLDHYAPLEGHLAVARYLLSETQALLATLHQDPAVVVLATEIAAFLVPTCGAEVVGSGEAPATSAPTDDA